MKALVGFSGSRHWDKQAVVRQLLASVATSGRQVAVGCANGLDAIVRAHCQDAMVFRADSRKPRDLVSRSIACVQAVAESGDGRGWIFFPGCQCPDKILPSRSSTACFSGSGSGSWASAALAAGTGIPVVVFGLERNQLPKTWGMWEQAGAASPWNQGFILRPKTKQLSLF
jgi:hypothetical protein